MRPLLRIAMALGLAAAVVPACFDGKELEGAECQSDADCWTDQGCAKSPTQAGEMLAGQCTSNGACKPGAQLGCSCLVGSDGLSCNAEFGSEPLYETSDDATTCICCRLEDVVVRAADGYLICSGPPEDGSSSGG
jgi:hypothetical protein